MDEYITIRPVNYRGGVKQERQDDQEIRELAAKMAEANKAKMAMPQRNQQTAGQGLNIFSFLTADKTKLKGPVQAATGTSADDSKNLDEDSAKGRFGWTSMGKLHIPYIIRSGENYCAVRMVEMKVLNKWLNYLHQDLYNCTNIRSYYITDAEAKLLNEINLKHCDYQFGREPFTTRDLIVRLSDANEFYQFLGHCYHKLVNTVEPDLPNRCGFIRINRESVVPYTVYNGQKFVPLFYFEGETENLKQRANKLEGWDLSYLKFCCKVQGIRNELFAHDSCSVISVNDIKSYFPPGTVFEDYWPKKHNLDQCQLLLNGRTSLQQGVHWTRQPSVPPTPNHPPPSPKPATQAKAATNGPLPTIHAYPNNYAALTGGQPPYHAAQPRAASSAVRSNYTQVMRPIRGFYGGMGQAPPPPLVRTSYHFNHAAAYEQRLDESFWMGPYNAQKSLQDYTVVEIQNNYHQSTSQGNYPAPPVLQHMNGSVSRYNTPQSSNFGGNRTLEQLVNQNPAHQSSSRTQTAATSAQDGNSTLTNGRGLVNNTSSRSKPTNVPESNAPSTTPTNIPYKLQKAQVQGKMLHLINMKANVFNEHLVTLQDVVENFFPGITLQNCQQVLQVLGIEVYKANPGQLSVLIDGGKCGRTDIVPLVQIRNVIDYMPQLKYMLGRVAPELPAKHQRNS